MINRIFIGQFLAVFLFCSAQLCAEDILTQLHKHLPNATIEETKAGDYFKREFTIMLSQNIDHKDPAVGQFQQRIFLSHYDVNAPNVIVTEGYSARPRYYELSQILKANQIQVEYRFFGESIPENKDYRYLKNDHAAADLHQIRKQLSKIYKGKWAATGISKGGTTTLIYKSKYPKDVTVAIPIVGPLPKAREDKRCDDHILSIGTKNCRDNIEAFQHKVLGLRKLFLTKIDSLATQNNLTYQTLSIPAAFEYAVLEFSFSFWQFGHDCNRLDRDMTDHQTFVLFNEIVGIDFFSDAVIDYFKPSYFQFMTENGYYGFIHKPFVPELKVVNDYTNMVFSPEAKSIPFDRNYMISVRNWIYQYGDKIIHIHGGLDPWGALRDPIHPKRDAHMIIDENGDHSTRISTLDMHQKELIYKVLAQWMDCDIFPLEK